MHIIVDFIGQANPLVIYTIVAVTLLLESSGIPIANNTLLLLTGAMTAFGHLNIWILICAAILGSILGACSAYAIGMHGGRRVFSRVTTFFHVSERKVSFTERWFQKAGFGMIFLSRMTPYVRPFACFFGGITVMPFRRFFVAALSGSIIWCIVIVHIGAALGPHWQLALILIRNYTLPTLCILVGMIVIYVGMRFVLRRYLLRSIEIEPTSVEAANEKQQNDLVEI